MAVTVTQLSAAIRVGDGTTAPEEPLASILTRLLGVASAFVSLTASEAPEAVRDEATVRFCSYLYDQPAASGDSYANAWVNSGAGALLSTVDNETRHHRGWSEHMLTQLKLAQPEHEARQESMTDLVVSRILANAEGSTALPEATAVAEIAAGIWSRAFAAVRVEPAGSAQARALKPMVMAGIGRSLLRTGNALFEIDVTQTGSCGCCLSQSSTSQAVQTSGHGPTRSHAPDPQRQ